MKLLNWLNDLTTPEIEPPSEPHELAPALKARLSELESMPVEKVMVARALINGLDVDIQLRRHRRIKSAKVSYFPVYRGDLDQILGWVAKDQVVAILNEKSEDTPLLTYIKPVGEVSDRASVADLADAFLAAGSPFLVVKNDSKQTLGIVPLSEFVEKVFGFEVNPTGRGLEIATSPNRPYEI